MCTRDSALFGPATLFVELPNTTEQPMCGRIHMLILYESTISETSLKCTDWPVYIGDLRDLNSVN
jgi:hypothetical protein